MIFQYLWAVLGIPFFGSHRDVVSILYIIVPVSFHNVFSVLGTIFLEIFGVLGIMFLTICHNISSVLGIIFLIICQSMVMGLSTICHHMFSVIGTPFIALFRITYTAYMTVSSEIRGTSIGFIESRAADPTDPRYGASDGLGGSGAYDVKIAPAFGRHRHRHRDMMDKGDL